jgi:hypothetical protein
LIPPAAARTVILKLERSARAIVVFCNILGTLEHSITENALVMAELEMAIWYRDAMMEV